MRSRTRPELRFRAPLNISICRKRKRGKSLAIASIAEKRNRILVGKLNINEIALARRLTIPSSEFPFYPRY